MNSVTAVTKSMEALGATIIKPLNEKTHLLLNILYKVSLIKKNNADKSPCTTMKCPANALLDGPKTNNIMVNWAISCTVVYATIFLKSDCLNIAADDAIPPLNNKHIAITLVGYESNGKNLYKPKSAILTKKPLKNMEKLVTDST